jgi:hypothetical protein
LVKNLHNLADYTLPSPSGPAKRKMEKGKTGRINALLNQNENLPVRHFSVKK